VRKAFEPECQGDIRQRLETIRRIIGITACETLLPGLELYARELEEQLKVKAAQR
jgi:hypothetical protein